ncbi:COR domain-containing protein [Polaribacter sp. NJDZ03]|uniref:COR domain-containing protein n=1 Tax=Polaribacter sp. NJDZ03 TaxID=2855841 RepID=UPI001C49E6D3|nr:COR domain-containing protein [Polaribacter sp. NJDZ03]
MEKERIMQESITKQDKPIKILELEEIYDIVLEQEPEENLFNDGLRQMRDFFVTNEENNIIALGISNRNVNTAIMDLSPISNLKNLTSLSLSNNNIEDISSIHPNPNLRHLFLGGNKIDDISLLLKFPLLEVLAIWNNPISDEYPLSLLTNLEELYCQKIGLKNLNFVSSLNKLEKLNASENEIIDIEILTKNTKIKELILSNNKIKIIPTKLAEKFEWLDSNIDEVEEFFIDEGINIRNNPLEYPPNSVIELGAETIKNYYEATDEFGHAPLSEGRIIVVGDGSAGKSSLIERVLYNTFEQGKSQTNGVFIENWKLIHTDNRELTFHLWDFGGQEIQHAIHKFFFTEGCLYILVLDNRKEEEPEYWLQQIESLGGKADVLVVFNKQDDNTTEIADRKFLKEKYPNIVGFYNTSCKTGCGINEFKRDLENQVVKLQTVDEQFPNNWFKIKKEIKECTSGDQHYLDYKTYSEICNRNNAGNEKTQKLLLKYFTTIGAVTWFGDTYLNFLHVLSPKWITQGVYKIITSKKTASLFGVININHFEELLLPISDEDYTYDETHYGYILSMMKKFDLCYTPDDETLLIPSAFGKVPKVEYSDFRGEGVRTYILQFKDYMPLALIHRFTAKKLPFAYDNNYWYSGIVIKDSKSESISMIHADKEAKRIYVRIKGNEKLGMWEHIRRELHEIASSYAQISYSELISLDEDSRNTVAYEDLLSHISANKSIYFHSKSRKDYNVGYLIGMFESKEQTLEKYKKDELVFQEKGGNLVLNILNNNSPTVNTQLNTQINIDIDINIVNNISSTVKGDALYLLEELGYSNKVLSEALKKVMQFADDSKSATNSGDVKEKGWGRKLKSVLKTLGNAKEQLKNIQDGGEALKSILKGLKDLSTQFNLDDLKNLFEGIL